MTQYGELIAFPKGMTFGEAELAISGRNLNRFGALHIVLDDYNVEDSHINFCLRLKDITDGERDWADKLKSIPVKRREALLRFSNYLGCDQCP